MTARPAAFSDLMLLKAIKPEFYNFVFTLTRASFYVRFGVPGACVNFAFCVWLSVSVQSIAWKDPSPK